MTLRELVEYGEQMLKSAGIEDYKNDVKFLAMEAFEYTYTEYILNMSEHMNADKQVLFEEYILIRTNRIPCQYIVCKKNFMGYDFNVSEGVLIPRPETELLVEKALQICKNRLEVDVLDMCTGSGCIGISFKLYREMENFSKDRILLADISSKAIEVAGKNNSELLGGRCEIIQTDLFANIEGKFDMILSNPPYIKTKDVDELMIEVRDFEPRIALDGMEDGLYFYDIIIKEARKHLNENGKLLFEIGYDQYEELQKLLIAAGYKDIELIKDYAGLDRIITATIC